MKTSRQSYSDLIYLICCAVNSVRPDPARLDGIDIDTILDLASHHMMTAMVSMALESGGKADPRTGQAIGLSLRKTAFFDAARKQVLDRLEQNGIRYLPLKGIILKDLYPKYGMREMCDHDILIDGERIGDVREIMQELGFSGHSEKGELHEAFFRKPYLNFEMHYQLFGPGSGEKLYRYYQNIKDRLQKDPDNAYGWHFSPEDFYVFLIAHAYRHWSSEGIGLRLLTDIYVYRKKTVLSDPDIVRELEKIDLAGFEEQIRSLAMHLFSGEPLTEAEEQTLDSFLEYGPDKIYEFLIGEDVQRSFEERFGKAGYILNRLFPSMEQIKEADPFFYNHKILLPFFLPYRLIRAAVKRRKKAAAEIKAIFKG